MNSCEFLSARKVAHSGQDIIRAMQDASPMQVNSTMHYRGKSDILMVWGCGSAANSEAIAKQKQKGGRVICWDYGYFGRQKRNGYLRVSIDETHPQKWIECTNPAPDRWGKHGISLREDFDPDGHIVLVGMGPKSHAFLKSWGWEKGKLDELGNRFPGKEIVFRPKRGHRYGGLECRTVEGGSIDDVLRGASLVVCRHSNVAVDAVVAGVPFECEDGAAQWLSRKPFTIDNRLDFMRRLAYWQWHHSEAAKAWEFLLGVIDADSKPVQAAAT
jgi:hypothetical protein